MIKKLCSAFIGLAMFLAVLDYWMKPFIREDFTSER